MVNHVNAERRVVVGFNVRGADLGAVAEGAQAAVARAVDLPAGTRVEWGGQMENLDQARGRLLSVIPAVLVLIFVLLVAAFGKVRPAAILLTQIPFATVGGIAVLSLRGMPVSISSIIGFIALAGIAVLNGVVLMNEILRNERAGMQPAEAAARAAVTRARPVMMTALVAALGFVPMALATGVGAEVQRPLATVVVGGLVTSTVLTLFVLPTLYPWLAKIGKAPIRKEEDSAHAALGG
jgi:cobalt-zinc-cadmium resistance protein CzcA